MPSVSETRHLKALAAVNTPLIADKESAERGFCAGKPQRSKGESGEHAAPKLAPETARGPVKNASWLHLVVMTEVDEGPPEMCLEQVLSFTAPYFSESSPGPQLLVTRSLPSHRLLLCI